MRHDHRAASLATRDNKPCGSSDSTAASHYIYMNYVCHDLRLVGQHGATARGAARRGLLDRVAAALTQQLEPLARVRQAVDGEEVLAELDPPPGRPHTFYFAPAARCDHETGGE